MPCFSPKQASYKINSNGKKTIQFSYTRPASISKDNNLLLPCGKCRDCLLKRSHQWAVRCIHEASLYKDNSFITLTYNDEFLKEMCPTGSLNRKHIQDFMKRLRKNFSYGVRYLDVKDVSRTYKSTMIRFFLAGEYGEKLDRPHYHLILFNVDFPDKTYWKTVNGNPLYRSSCLEKLWKFGFSSIGSVTFESATYVARTSLKKVTGAKAEEHYQRVSPVTGELVQLLPEFLQASLKPGLGKFWFDKFGMTDVYPEDACTINGFKSKPSGYYDKLLERNNSDLFLKIKTQRVKKHADKENNSDLGLLKENT